METPSKERERFRFWRWIAAALLLVAAIPLLWGQAPAPLKPAPVAPDEVWDVPGEIVVDLRDDATQADITSLAQKYGAAFDGPEPAANTGRILTIKTAPTLVQTLLARLRADPFVEAAEPQRLFRAFWKPNDPRYHEQWNFRRINMEQAWDVTRGKGAVVAVIDTGVAFEKDSKCYLCKDFTQTKFTQPYDFIGRDKHPTDDHGHGTHVAGTIAESTNNGEGVAGIAFEAKIMPLKVLTKEGYGRMSDVAAAIRYAADHGAHLINMSLGGPFPDRITSSAVKYAYQRGVTLVCAAGNSGGEGVSYPAAYPECIAVSALGPTGALAPYSSWGREIAISAPGGDKTKGEDAGILQNTYLRMRESDLEEFGYRLVQEAGSSAASAGETQVDDYFSFQGTSMATPHVAGVAALVVSLGVKDPAEVKAILQKSAQPRGDRKQYGAGELDAAAAVKRAKAASSDYYGRLWLLGGIWLGALALGWGQKRRHRAMLRNMALALTVGLFFPDVIQAFAGFDSPWNLLGHSVLVPAVLLISEAKTPAQRRFYTLFAAGLALHLGWDIWFGSAPFLGDVTWAALPWLWTNVLVGIGAVVTGLRRA